MVKLLRDIATLIKVHKSWEDVCSRCGECCFERELHDDGMLVTDYASPCRFLDLETARCTVYERRFEMCSRCHRVTPLIAMRGRQLPETCAYRKLFG